MLTVALTGGIGSGKSLAGEYFRSLGAVVVDSDLLARAVIERGTEGFDQVVSRFGDEILKSGAIDRKKLGAIVFADLNARSDLELIVHPLIRAAFAKIQNTVKDFEILINEIPLLVESKNGSQFDFIITVSASEVIRRGRLLAKGLKEFEITQRLCAQATDHEREEIADYVIVNEGSSEELFRNVENVYEEKLLVLLNGE